MLSLLPFCLLQNASGQSARFYSALATLNRHHSSLCYLHFPLRSILSLQVFFGASDNQSATGSARAFHIWLNAIVCMSRTRTLPSVHFRLTATGGLAAFPLASECRKHRTDTRKGNAEITALPDLISLKIFRGLPFKDLVRSGRVCRRFFGLSTHVLAESRSVDLSDPLFRRICPDQLYILVGLCAGKLEHIVFPTVLHLHKVEVFAQFHFPRLTELKLGRSDIGNKMFGQLVLNCPNLRSLTWGNFHTWVVYPDVTSNNLKTLKVSRADDAFFRSLTGRCPRLKQLEVNIIARVNGDSFDKFFAHCPNLETLSVGDIHIRGEARFQSMQHFWSLSSLRVLRIGDVDHRKMGDTDLEKMPSSFPLLEHLELNQLSVTNWGVASLAALKNLSQLTLSFKDRSAEISDGIRRIAECGNLLEARFDIDISKTAFSALIRFCHRLRFLYVRAVQDVETAAIAAEIMGSIGGCKTDLVIRVLKGFEVWNSAETKLILKQLQASTGHGIEFECGYLDFLLYGREIVDEMEVGCC